MTFQESVAQPVSLKGHVEGHVSLQQKPLHETTHQAELFETKDTKPDAILVKEHGLGAILI